MKNTLKSVLVAATLVVASIALTGTIDHHRKDIVDTAAASKDFKTLVAAVKAAGLVEALKSEGPFTVFAPTEKAFEMLEKEKPGTIATLLKPENKKMLERILKYHVVSGKVMAADVVKMKNGTAVKTLSGDTFKLGLGKDVTINNAKVIKTDITCTNGVIHVIDTVILPPTK
jgi:uncharacterized surface protein with fasciclin (FAS1) repeats